MKKLMALIALVVTAGLTPLLFGIYGSEFDTLTQEVPFIIETKRMFASGAPWWSWNTLFGDNFIGGYSFYTVTSPFVWFICLFPREYILLGMIIALYLKFMAAGATAYSFFKYVGIDKDKCTLGGLCYATSSFFITNLFYYHFCEPIIVFPLLLIAVEKVLRNNRYAVSFLALISFVTVWINFYFSLPSFLLGFFYFVARYIQDYQKLKAEKRRYVVVFKAFVGVLLGCIMSSAILLPTVLHVGGSGRSTTDFNIKTNVGFQVQSFLGGLAAYFVPRISESHSVFNAPLWCSNSVFLPVIGSISLVWSITHFKRLNECLRIKWLSLLIIALFIVSLTPLNRIFDGFTKPNYTRWFYGMSLFMIYAFIVIIKNYSISRRLYWLYIVISAALIAIIMVSNALVSYVHHTGFDFSLDEANRIGLGLFVLNMIFLGIYVYRRNISCLTLFATFTASLNLAAFVYVHISSDENKDSDYMHSYVLDDKLLSYNTAEFEYRTDFKSIYPDMAQLKNYPSVMNFHSVSNKNMNCLRMIITKNLKSPDIEIHHQRSSVDVLMSVKYYVDYGEEPKRIAPMDYSAVEPIDTTELFTRYRFKYYIPMGFCYDSYVTHDEFNEYLATCPKDSVMPLLENLVIEAEDVSALSKHLRHAKINPNATLDSLTHERRKYCATSFVGDTRGCKLTTNFDEERVMFLSVVADPGFTATIDGVKTQIYTANLGLSAIVVPKGKHYIDFDYETPGLKLGCIISLCALLILLIIAYAERKQVKFCVERS
jgi:uncharacterized membrane protein YfhO